MSNMLNYLVLVLVLSGFSTCHRTKRGARDSIACGEVIPEEDQLIWNFEGKQAKRGAYPWHVAIYKTEDNDFRCDGTIISKHVVLTAANCVTYFDGRAKPDSDYYVQAGKLFSEWNATKDRFLVQKRSVSKIVLSNYYFPDNYSGDIAIMILDKPFRISRFVRPVCVDWNSEYVDEHLKSGVMGQVVGWGGIIGFEPSIFLKQFKFPFVERDQCVNRVPQDSVQFLTPDKYCAGSTNGTGLSSLRVGGCGMIFSIEHCGTTKYYIQGIASVCLSNRSGCNENELSFYTQLSSHINWLKETLEANNFTFTNKIMLTEKEK